MKFKDYSKNFRINNVINNINEYFDVDTQNPVRKLEILIPRQMAMYYIRKNFKITSEKIGRYFPSERSKSGFKDHASVLYACSKVEGYLEYDKEIQGYDKDLKDKIKRLSTLSLDEAKLEIKKDQILKDIDTLDMEQLKRIHKYIKSYYCYEI